MTSWRVVLAPAARSLRRRRPAELLAQRGIILSLAEDRRPPGARRLRGMDLWRVRVRIDGAWRVVYQVRQRETLVVVTRVIRRDEATYRGL